MRLALRHTFDEEGHVYDLCPSVPASSALSADEVKGRDSVRIYHRSVVLIECSDLSQCPGAERGDNPRCLATLLEVRIEGGDIAEYSEHDLRYENVGHNGLALRDCFREVHEAPNV